MIENNTFKLFELCDIIREKYEDLAALTAFW